MIDLHRYFDDEGTVERNQLVLESERISAGDLQDAPSKRMENRRPMCPTPLLRTRFLGPRSHGLVKGGTMHFE